MMEKAETINKTLSAEKQINVVGLRVNVGDLETAGRKVLDLVRRGKGGYLCVSTVHMTMEARDHPDFAEIVRGADFVTADGMPMVWMQKLQGARNAARVRGVDLMQRLFTLAEQENLSVGFYGGRQEVLDEISARLQTEHPNLQISYIHSPPFRALTAAEDAAITAAIEESETDILFVGLGCPKQEQWIWEHTEGSPAVMIGVGAAFDFYAGNIKEAPRWIGKLGLEWFVRLLQEPRRLWRRYILLNPRFIWLATLQLLGLKKFR